MQKLKLKSFNINNYIYIKITKDGWKHLYKTLEESYIENYIMNPSYEKVVNGEVWYRLQAHEVFELLPMSIGGKILYETNIMIDEEFLI